MSDVIHDHEDDAGVRERMKAFRTAATAPPEARAAFTDRPTRAAWIALGPCMACQDKDKHLRNVRRALIGYIAALWRSRNRQKRVGDEIGADLARGILRHQLTILAALYTEDPL